MEGQSNQITSHRDYLVRESSAFADGFIIGFAFALLLAAIAVALQ